MEISSEVFNEPAMFKLPIGVTLKVYTPFAGFTDRKLVHKNLFELAMACKYLTGDISYCVKSLGMIWRFQCKPDTNSNLDTLKLAHGIFKKLHPIDKNTGMVLQSEDMSINICENTKDGYIYSFGTDKKLLSKLLPDDL